MRNIGYKGDAVMSHFEKLKVINKRIEINKYSVLCLALPLLIVHISSVVMLAQWKISFASFK
jgi:hypothetical protein